MENEKEFTAWWLSVLNGESCWYIHFSLDSCMVFLWVYLHPYHLWRSFATELNVSILLCWNQKHVPSDEIEGVWLVNECQRWACLAEYSSNCLRSHSLIHSFFLFLNRRTACYIYLVLSINFIYFPLFALSFVLFLLIYKYYLEQRHQKCSKPFMKPEVCTCVIPE